MADSNITKRALATAFKELIETEPFSKISIGELCDKCDLSRKSFYYHFKDKYDLVNWIYYTEFFKIAQQKEYTLGWDLLEDLCSYFYENQDFYRKTFNIVGQNSFSEYFRNIVVMIITNIMEKFYQENDPIDFYVDFYSDAFFCAIKKWITEKDCMPAHTFVHQLKQCILGTSSKLIEQFAEAYAE